MEKRKCYSCKKDKRLDDFSKKTKETGGIAYQCKTCKKDENFKRRYNITIDNYNELFNSQFGKCKICNKHQSEFAKALHVDHCHISGKVRGLLCNNCNRSLGMFKDSISNLQLAIEYLKQSYL